MKIFFIMTFALFSCHSIAQPFVLSCDLDWKYIRDGVVEQNKTGVWCKSCRIAITIEDKSKLHLDHVPPSFGYFYNTNNKIDLDSNGFGYPGTWTINNKIISANNRIFEYSKENGSVYLEINRLTGHFHASSTKKNPIGSGNIEEQLTGECQASKAAF